MIERRRSEKISVEVDKLLGNVLLFVAGAVFVLTLDMLMRL